RGPAGEAGTGPAPPTPTPSTPTAPPPPPAETPDLEPLWLEARARASAPDDADVLALVANTLRAAAIERGMELGVHRLSAACRAAPDRRGQDAEAPDHRAVQHPAAARQLRCAARQP